MQPQEDLLNEVRPFCDASTGEVVKRIPEELMQRLRAAKLATGIQRRPNQRTESQATWFVFLSDEIRDRILALRRDCRRGMKAKPEGNARSSHVRSARGLGDFRRRKQS